MSLNTSLQKDKKYSYAYSESNTLDIIQSLIASYDFDNHF